MKSIFDDFNGTYNCGVYIGIEAGKLLREYILNAKKSLLIISPYISDDMVEILEKKSGWECPSITIITSEENKNFNKLIKREEEENLELVEKKKVISQNAFNLGNEIKQIPKLVKKIELYFILAILVTILSCFAFMYFKNMIGIVISIAMAIAVIIAYFVINRIITNKRQKKEEQLTGLINKINSMKTTSYIYHSKFNLHVFEGLGLIHAKIYIIDGTTLFTGSLNLTNAGFYSNCEVCIKSHDTKLICGIHDNIYDLINKARTILLDKLYNSSQLK